MERFIVTQTKTNKSLDEFINLLTSRINAMAAQESLKLTPEVMSMSSS